VRSMCLSVFHFGFKKWYEVLLEKFQFLFKQLRFVGVS
ncbi:MAG: hypothetical protein ACI93N_000862, partial [Flavobacteriaceae bacterium]